MPSSEISTVDDYIGAIPEPVQSMLKQVRAIIRQTLPDAEEMISYKIPAYKLHGKPIIYFAGWKKHYSLYPVGEEVAAAFADELSEYDMSKGTVRFELSEPVPVKLIARIVAFRAGKITGTATDKS